MTDIIVVGSLNMDLVVRVERNPAAGETIPGSDLQTIPGGKGSNQAAAVARLGGSVAMVGRVGEDAFGPRLVNALKTAGVNTQHIIFDPDTATGTALILVSKNGQNSIVISAGANGRASPQDLKALEGLIRKAQLVLLQFEIPMGTVDHVIRMASQYGVRVILNPAPARQVSTEMLSKVDYLVPNEIEAKLLTGVSVDDLTSAEEAARKLLSMGVKHVVLTLGEKGALLVDAECKVHIPTQVVKVVDTTAAGDAFIGGLAVALVRKLPLIEAVRYACCAGTLAVTKFGAQTSLPSGEEVQEFYARGL